jgi:hypothetical protein
MNLNRPIFREQALTAIEVLIIICALFIVAALLLPRTTGNHGKAPRVRCTSSLKQVALAFHLWSIDHEGTRLPQFPWQVQTPVGTLPHADSPQVFRHFAVISNELQNTQALTCPSDKARKPTTSWTALRNENISYFINVTQFKFPEGVLAGDRHLSTNANILRGVHVISDPAVLRWTKDIHPQQGNVALLDTSVQQVTTKGAQSLFTNVPIRLAIP